jgi:hypothetical protein
MNETVADLCDKVETGAMEVGKCVLKIGWHSFFLYLTLCLCRHCLLSMGCFCYAISAEISRQKCLFFLFVLRKAESQRVERFIRLKNKNQNSTF